MKRLLSLFGVKRGETVKELAAFPQMDTGAPSPLILANDNRLALIYYLNDNPSPDGTYETVRRQRSESEPGPVAFVKASFTAIRFGYPNDEALAGHRLYPKGLRHYGVWEVMDSEWPGELDKANAVHPRHIPGLFRGRHIVFTFHDTTLELLGEDLEVEVREQSAVGLLPEMLKYIQSI